MPDTSLLAKESHKTELSDLLEGSKNYKIANTLASPAPAPYVAPPVPSPTSIFDEEVESTRLKTFFTEFLASLEEGKTTRIKPLDKKQLDALGVLKFTLPKHTIDDPNLRAFYDFLCTNLKPSKSSDESSPLFIQDKWKELLNAFEKEKPKAARAVRETLSKFSEKPKADLVYTLYKSLKSLDKIKLGIFMWNYMESSIPYFKKLLQDEPEMKNDLIKILTKWKKPTVLKKRGHSEISSDSSEAQKVDETKSPSTLKKQKIDEKLIEKAIQEGLSAIDSEKNGNNTLANEQYKNSALTFIKAWGISSEPNTSSLTSAPNSPQMPALPPETTETDVDSTQALIRSKSSFFSASTSFNASTSSTTIMEDTDPNVTLN